MGTSITKSGILLADGTGVGENLIVNSNAGILSTSSSGVANWNKWAKATGQSIEAIDGKTWFHCVSPDSTKYGGFNQNYVNRGLESGEKEIKPNTYYTVSGIWFASEECTCRYWFHMNSTDGGGNISQPSKVITVTTVPTRLYFSFNTGSSATYEINRFNLMLGPVFAQEGIDVYFTDIKMEEGQIATPWCLSSRDVNYTGTHSFFEGYNPASIGDGYSTANEFYEY